MNFRILTISAAITLCSMAAFAQDGPFQVRYASNLNVGDSVVNITNTGASSTVAFGGPPLRAQNGNICVNVYTFDPAEELISCCTCSVTPDGLASLSANNDLVNNTLTGRANPTSIVIKLLATSGSGAACNAGSPGVGGNLIVPGLAAWGTTIHALPAPPASTAAGLFGVTETAFTNATLSAAELVRISTLCAISIQSNGSGFGVCRSCRLGGQGGQRQ